MADGGAAEALPPDYLPIQRPVGAPIASFCYCVAIFLLDETVQRGAEHFDRFALACVPAAIFFVALPLFLPPLFFSRRALHGLIAVGVIAGFCRLPLLSLFWRFPASRQLLLPFVVLAVIAAILSFAVLLRLPRSLVGGVFALLLLDVGLMSWFFLNLSASPHIDAYVMQEYGCETLLNGRDPFAMTFPDIYGPDSGFYAQGLVSNGQVQCGYAYPPLSLLLDLPGYLAGDLRYGQLAALLISAAIIGYSRRHFAPAIWLLFTPNALHILENSWTETYLIALMAIIVWCNERRSTLLAPVAVGLLLVTKQYALLTIPAVVLLLATPLHRRTIVRFGLTALVAGSAVTLPFILWNPSAFLRSVTVPYASLLRSDSISFLPTISRFFGTHLTLLCPLAAAVPPSIVVLRRSPRSASGFAAAVALICLCVFAFSTQAFINYYFFAVAALCTAIAFEAPRNAHLGEANPV